MYGQWDKSYDILLCICITIIVARKDCNTTITSINTQNWNIPFHSCTLAQLLDILCTKTERFLSTFSQDIPLASLLLWRGIYPFRRYRFLEYATSCDWRCRRMNRFVTAPLMQLWDKALNVGKLSPQIYFICTKYYIWQSVYPRGKIIILWYSYPWTNISNMTKNRILFMYYICFKHSFANKNKVIFSVLKSCRNEHCRNMDIFHSKFQLSRTRVYNFDVRHPRCV
jgi:hypothetical protein